MPVFYGYLAVYFVLINLTAAIVTLADKRRARRHKWRVRESTLLLLAALGGSPAMYLTMLIIRHKTKKIKFMLGIPLILLLQGAAIYLALACGLFPSPDAFRFHM
ncbi:MAG: DUF1294 domain-containing protein [Clostridiales bacterium]|nr:DUF1294 domain-containing protein [Clostridiales bacterium]